MTDLAVILAAGAGSRLQAENLAPHKALIDIGGQPIIAHTCQLLQQMGFREVIIVIGYQGHSVRQALEEQVDLDIKRTFVENRNWRRANGLSLLAAAEKLPQSYLLMMADHIFDPAIVQKLCRLSVLEGEVILAVDRNVDGIYDIDDATKVRIKGERILAIDKKLTDYNAIDTGFFLCSNALIKALQLEAEGGNCSLSDGVRKIAQEGNLRYFDIDSYWWQDIDTPGALHHGRRLWNQHINAIRRPMN